MTLMDAIARAHRAKKRVGPDGPTGLAIAARLPSLEERADAIVELDRDVSEAQALEVASVGRRVMLDTLEELLTEAGPGEEDG